MSILRKSFMWDYWSLRPIIQTPYAASVGIFWDRFLLLLTMFRLKNNNAKAATGKPDCDPLFKIRPVIDTLITKVQDVYTLEEHLTIIKTMPILRAYILLSLFQRKAPQTWNKNVWTLWGKKQLHLQPGSIHWGTSHRLRTQHGIQYC
jgi:hypothetical protein